MTTSLETNSKTTSLRVVKIGGSLFPLSDLKSRVENYLCELPEVGTVIIAGGGASADVIREWDKRFTLGEKIAHRLSCKQLSISTNLISSLLGVESICTDFSELKTATAKPLIIFDPARWALEQSDLEQSWRVTSDSISALLAQKLNADELILLKSTLPMQNTIASASLTGVVDPCFAIVSRGLKSVRCVNLSVSPAESIMLLED